jgi:predicted nuclease of predicted toxin-antitoxin system
MKFLADENVEKPIVDMLRDCGHDVLYISEFMKRSIDEQVLDQANHESRILLTNDKDFGELVYLQGKNSIGIILMRFFSERSSVKTKFILHLINKFFDRLFGHFTTISEAKIRFRKLKQF